MKPVIPVCLGLLFLAGTISAQEMKPPVRLALAGLNHDHAMGFLPRLQGRTDVQLVGIVETNADLIYGCLCPNGRHGS